MQLVIRNARLRKTDGLRDIGIEDGKVVEVAPRVSQKGESEIDADKGLVTASFVNLHFHLDKCLTGEWIRSAAGTDSGSLQIIPKASYIKRRFTEDDVQIRASEGVKLSVLYGTTAIRAFADVDTVGGLKSLRGLLRVKQKFKGIVDVQVVAFPQEGIARDPGSEELLHKAMEEGADVVGGMPWYELTPEDSKRHVDVVFDVARRHGKDIHMLVDDTDDPSASNIQYLLEKTLRERMNGRVAASHCRGMLATSNESYARRIVSMAKEARLSVVENPHISLMLYGQSHGFPQGRGITRVKEFVAAEVNVAIGQDDMDDPYYAFGRGDMLDLAAYMCHGAGMFTPPETEAVYDMITGNGARAMNLPRHGPEVGAYADLVVLNSTSVHDALRLRADCRYVTKGGRVVAETEVVRSIHSS